MKSVRNADDLKRYGFDCLTGEACGLNLRLLFDVTAEGKSLLETVLGVREITLLQDWNGGDAVGSCLLTREMITTVAIFGMLFRDNCIEVWQEVTNDTPSGEVFGIENEEELALAIDCNLARVGAAWRRFKRSPYPGSGDRNLHAVSGRVA